MSLLVGRITPGLVASPSRRRMTARRTCTTCAVLEQSYLEQSVAALTRRDFALSASAVLLISQLQAAHADESAGAATAVEAPAVASSSSSNNSGAPSRTLEPFIDNDFELQVPNNYRYLETEIPVVERGPQPERSPVLARFEPPAGGAGTISILRRKASALKQTLLQVNDISQLGDPISVAKLILPRGSTLVASAQQQVVQAPKETPLGQVELPPQNYYTFEFTTPTGLHVAMAAAAKKGSVLICGASTTADSWSEAGPVFRQVVKSFRLRSQAAIS